MVQPEGKLTPAQYEIMGLVWEAGDAGASVSGLWEAIGQQRQLTRTTIQNQVERLVKRRWLKRMKTLQGYRYLATTDRDQATRALAEEFVEEFFAGSASQLVQSLFGSKRLKREDLVQMRALLDAHLAKRRSK